MEKMEAVLTLIARRLSGFWGQVGELIKASAESLWNLLNRLQLRLPWLPTLAITDR